MSIEDDYAQWADDGKVLAQIGRSLFSQRRKVFVRIPRHLAEEAVARWARDSSGDDLPSPESAEQSAVRDRAATLGLIGLSIQQDGTVNGDDVVVDLDSWFVGNALKAAEQDDLLKDAPPPSD
ncbi:MAG TPA: hypothetical protein VIX84_18895 [Acidimicrobiales bacterium]